MRARRRLEELALSLLNQRKARVEVGGPLELLDADLHDVHLVRALRNSDGLARQRHARRHSEACADRTNRAEGTCPGRCLRRSAKHAMHDCAPSAPCSCIERSKTWSAIDGTTACTSASTMRQTCAPWPCRCRASHPLRVLGRSDWSATRVARATNLVRGRDDEQASLVELHSRLGDLSDDTACQCHDNLVRYGVPCWYSCLPNVFLRGSVARVIILSRARCARPIERMLPGQRTIRGVDAPVVDPSGTKTALDDLEAATPAEDEVALRHAHVLVDDLHVALGRVVVAEDVHRADDLHPGRVGGHDDDRLLAMAVRVVGVAVR